MDCSPPGSSVHGIFQARVLDWGAITFSRATTKNYYKQIEPKSTLFFSHSGCPTLWDPMDCSIPGFPVLHCLPDFAQPHVHWVKDANQPSQPLSSPSLPALNLSQHQSLFQWVGFSHQVPKVLELQLQHQSLWWISRIDFLSDWLVWSPCSPRDSQESSPTPQFKSIDSSVLSLLMVECSRLYMTTGKTISLSIRTFISQVMSQLTNMLSSFVTAFPRRPSIF